MSYHWMAHLTGALERESEVRISSLSLNWPDCWLGTLDTSRLSWLVIISVQSSIGTDAIRSCHKTRLAMQGLDPREGLWKGRGVPDPGP